MLLRKYFGLVLILAVSALSACGGGSDGGGTANPAASVALTVSKDRALANGNDAVTVQADVRTSDGSAVPDGTAVTFSASAVSCSLSASSAVTANGIASITMTHPAVTGAGNQPVTITGAAGSASGSKAIKFINQPTSVDVFVGFRAAVTNLAALQFILKNTAGASFDNNTQLISRINNAEAGSTSIILAGFNAAASSLTIGLANPNGFDTGTEPIIKATFSVAAGAGLPTFSIDTTPGAITSDPAVTPDNMAVTTTFDTER